MHDDAACCCSFLIPTLHKILRKLSPLLLKAAVFELSGLCYDGVCVPAGRAQRAGLCFRVRDVLAFMHNAGELESEHAALEATHAKTVLSEKEVRTSLQLAELRLASVSADRTDLQSRVSTSLACVLWAAEITCFLTTII